jgi:hypothetical protein
MAAVTGAEVYKAYGELADSSAPQALWPQFSLLLRAAVRMPQ